MKEIKCPNCGQVFKVDEADYANIVSQVKNQEFSAEVERRVQEMRRQMESEQKLSESESAQKFQSELNGKEMELAKKDSEIERLKGLLSGAESQKKNEIALAMAAKDKELEQLKTKIAQSDANLKVAVMEAQNRASEEIRKKDNEIATLNTRIEAVKNEALNRESNMKNEYELQLKQSQELVEQYKNFRQRLSTKMLGESLEQHCSNEFAKVRVTMYPNAYFEKDNDASGGSKGDFIFRDFIQDANDAESDKPIEYISIMFEMKNEMDETATKHKNEDFFAKLDKDRNAKGCEYAVLVSMLEQDSELYNEGIVDVSYRYPKMYVVRPQFFMPIISLLSQTSKKSIGYKRELEIAKRQSIDVTNFENKLLEFKNNFGKHYSKANEKFGNAIDDIDKAIAQLNKIKEALVGSETYLRRANGDIENLTIKKLTWNNPTMKQKFDEARKS